MAKNALAVELMDNEWDAILTLLGTKVADLRAAGHREAAKQWEAIMTSLEDGLAIAEAQQDDEEA